YPMLPKPTKPSVSPIVNLLRSRFLSAAGYRLSICKTCGSPVLLRYHDSPASNQYASKKDNNATEGNLHGRRKGRRLHIAVADPSNGAQLHQNHGDGDSHGNGELVD